MLLKFTLFSCYNFSCNGYFLTVCRLPCTFVSSQNKANMIYHVKDVALYKADQIICLRVPVRVLCIAMEVSILNNWACTYSNIIAPCTVQYWETSIPVNPSPFSLSLGPNRHS